MQIALRCLLVGGIILAGFGFSFTAQSGFFDPKPSRLLNQSEAKKSKKNLIIMQKPNGEVFLRWRVRTSDIVLGLHEIISGKNSFITYEALGSFVFLTDLDKPGFDQIFGSGKRYGWSLDRKVPLKGDYIFGRVHSNNAQIGAHISQSVLTGSDISKMETLYIPFSLTNKDGRIVPILPPTGDTIRITVTAAAYRSGTNFPHRFGPKRDVIIIDLTKIRKQLKIDNPKPQHGRPDSETKEIATPVARETEPEAKPVPLPLPVAKLVALPPPIAKTTTAPLTRSEINGLRAHLMECIVKETSARHPLDLPIDLVVQIDARANGEIMRAELDRGTRFRSKRDRVRAMRAVAAIRNSRCKRLPLPREKHEYWKTIRLKLKGIV